MKLCYNYSQRYVIMLFERIQYENDLPFFATFSNIYEEDYHMHGEAEIMLVLRGSTYCKIHHLEYEIKKGDVLIVDTQDLHRIHDSSDDLLLLTIYIDLERFTDEYPNLDYMIFACEDCTKDYYEKYEGLQRKTALLKSHMARLMLAVNKDPNNEKLLISYINEFVAILVEQFQGFFVEDMKFKANQENARGINFERLYRIIKYIYLNHDKDVTLKDVAELEHLNHYYVSHLIKNYTGLSFQNFLNYIRVERAENYLVEGDFTLTQISEFCGFSSLAYLNKCFEKWHGMTPSIYRKNLKRYQRSHCQPFSPEDALILLSSYMNDYSRINKPPSASFSEEKMLAHINQQLKTLNKEGQKHAYAYIKYLAEQGEYI